MMKRIIWVRLFAVLIFAVAITSWVVSAQQIAPTFNWTELEQTLQQKMKAPGVDSQLVSMETLLSWEWFNDIPEVQQIEQTGNARLWQEMVACPDTPNVNLVGFHCIARNRADLATSAALSAYANREFTDPFAPMQPYRIHLQKLEGDWNDDDLNVFSAFMSRPSTKEQRGNLVLIVDDMPESLLFKWIRIKRHLTVPTSNEAVVIGRLMGVKHASEKDRATVNDIVNSYVAIPGYPGYIYLWQCDPDAPKFSERLEASLLDEELSRLDVMGLANRHRTSILGMQQQLVSKAADVSPEREELLKLIIKSRQRDEIDSR